MVSMGMFTLIMLGAILLLLLLLFHRIERTVTDPAKCGLAQFETRLEDFRRIAREELARHRMECAVRLQKGFEDISTSCKILSESVKSELAGARDDVTQNAKIICEEVFGSLKTYSKVLANRSGEIEDHWKDPFKFLARNLFNLTQKLGSGLQAARMEIDHSLKHLRDNHSTKMPGTGQHVEDKTFHATVELRLEESLKYVSDQLEQLQMELGEIEALASRVRSLKKGS